METLIQKLGSRKLWITLLALAGVSVQEIQGAEWWQQAIIGAIAIGYVLAEALVDRARANPLDEYGDPALEQAEETIRAIKEGLVRGQLAAGELGAPGDVGALPSPAAARVDPNLVILLVQLAERLLSLFKRRKK